MSRYLENNGNPKLGRIAIDLCADGYVISVQAGRYCYSLPENADRHFTHVEVMPMVEGESLLQVYDDGTICHYVPIQIVNDIVNKHGGAVSVSYHNTLIN